MTASSQDQVLLVERAASIGWYFIESYYDFYNQNVESIYKLYHPNASLLHSTFPGSVKTRTIHKATGLESIKGRFSGDSTLRNAKNRIVILSADIQVSLRDKILIVVFGEWSRSGSPYYPFTQSFILCPGKKENTFDLANDNLRFIDLEGLSEALVREEPEKIDQESAPHSNSGVEQSSAVVNEENKSQKIGTSIPNLEVSSKEPELNGHIDKEDTRKGNDFEKPEQSRHSQEPIKSGILWSDFDDETPSDNKQEGNVEETIEQSNAAEISKVSSKADSKNVVKQNVQELADDTNKEKETTETSALPSQKHDEDLKQSQPLSWAALAASSAKSGVAGTTPKASVRKTTQTAAGALPSQTPAQPNSNGKYKKEDWFPIYIRGVKDINEEVLRKHLVKEFGEIKFFRIFVNIALCDFVDGESQRRALDAKETVVDGTVIQLEVRESKNSTKSNVKGQKEKANVNMNTSNGEKRGRNEKKQVGKKNRPNTKSIE